MRPFGSRPARYLLVARLAAGFLASCAVLAGPNVDQEEERRILVAFHDGSIDRVPSGDSTNGYRRRGHYDTSTWGDGQATDLAGDHRLGQLGQWPIPALGMHCVVYRVAADRSVEQTLESLQQDRRVALAERMSIFHTTGAPTGTEGDPYAQLQPALRAMRVQQVHPHLTGRGVRIGIIDTGLDPTHPDLAGQVETMENFTEHEDAQAADIHGTAVAGIIAARAHNHAGIVGVAPDARISALKACWPETPNRPESVCDTFTLAQALNSAIQKRLPVVNMSLSGPRDPLLELLLKKGLEQGIVFVAAVPPEPSGGDFPSSVEGVIAVRSAGGASISRSLSVHPVAAPGTEILTTLPNASYNFVTGSSYATAHVTGVIALLLQAQDALAPSLALNLLQGSGSSADPAVVDACAAVARIDPHLTCPAMP